MHMERMHMERMQQQQKDTNLNQRGTENVHTSQYAGAGSVYQDY